MVHGWRKRVVKARLWLRILRIAFTSYRSPTRAWRVLARMRAERGKVQRWSTQKYAAASGRYFWNLYAPGFPSPAFDRYIAHELDRVEPFRGSSPAFQSVVFAFTRRCALRCDHCCEWDTLNAPEALSRAEVLEVVRRVLQRGTTQLFLSGGEPLRRFGELLEVVRLASPDADTWILSSGHGLTGERAAQLRAAGLTGVSLSLDDWDPSSHDRFRGMSGIFDAVRSAAAAATAHGLLVALSLCPTRDFTTADNLARYADVAQDLGAAFIQLLEPKPVGHFAGQDVALTPPQQRLLESFADRLNGDPDSRNLPGVSYQDYSRRMVGCHGAGDRHLYIDTAGVLHPCPFCRSGNGCALDGDFDARVADLQAGGCHVPGDGASHV